MKNSFLKVFSDENAVNDYKQLMTDYALGRLEDGVTKKEANDKIRQIQLNLMGIYSENPTKREIAKAMRKHKTEVFELIEDTVINLTNEGWGNSPFYNRFVERRSGALGDANEFYVESAALLTVEKFSGAHHNIFRQKLGIGESFNVPTNAYAIKIYEEYELFITGRIDWAECITKVYKSFDFYTNTMIAEAVQGIATQLPNADIFSKSGQLGSATKDIFDELVENVQAANNGAKVVIMGTKTALRKLEAIVDVDWASNEYKYDREQLGRIGSYGGDDVLEIPQVFANGDYSTKLVDDDKIYIIAENNQFIKLFDEGDDMIVERTENDDNRDMTVEYEYIKRMGYGIVISAQFGLWTIEE